MEVELELRDDAEVAAATAQSPEQVRVVGLARVDEPAVRRDDVGRDEVVAREAELAHRPADAAAEREPGDTGGRDEAARRREPVRLGLVVDVGPHRASADRRPTSGRIDADVAHPKEMHMPDLSSRRRLLQQFAVAAALLPSMTFIEAFAAAALPHLPPQKGRCGASRVRATPPHEKWSHPNQFPIGGGHWRFEKSNFSGVSPS